MAYGSGWTKNPKKETKYEDKNRGRFWKETTYAAEYKHNNKAKFEENRQIDDQVVSKYSNRIPKSQKPSSADRTKHRREIEDYKNKSQERKNKAQIWLW